LNPLYHELDSLTSLVCAFPGYPEARKDSYHWFKNWNVNVKKGYKVFKMHPMAKAHEGDLVTKFTGIITRIEVNTTIAHPLAFLSIIQDMDDWHEASNAPDLLHCLKKLDID